MMLNKVPRLLSAGLRGLFCCKCTPETSDPPSKESIAPKTRRGPHLSVFVEDPSDVRWDTPTPTPPMNEKFSRSVSNGSVGGQNGHQHTVVEVWTRIASENVIEPDKIKLAIQPNKPPLEPGVRNHREMLVQQTQPATSLSEVDETKSTGSSSVLPRSEETTDDQSLSRSRRKWRTVLPEARSSTKMSAIRCRWWMTRVIARYLLTQSPRGILCRHRHPLMLPVTEWMVGLCLSKRGCPGRRWTRTRARKWRRQASSLRRSLRRNQRSRRWYRGGDCRGYSIFQVQIARGGGRP